MVGRLSSRGAAHSDQTKHILIVDDDSALLESIADLLRAWGLSTTGIAVPLETLRWLEANACDLILLDIMMPGIDGITLLSQIRLRFPNTAVLMMTGRPTVERAVASMREGAVDFLSKPLEPAALKERVFANLQQATRKESLVSAAKNNRSEFLAVSDATTAIRTQIRHLVDVQADPILITGETGTGKDVVAREIHHLSGAPDNSFVAIAAPSLSDLLMESELFGHVKGSFTGAVADRKGFFELARGGVLFLDEVADLSPHGQATLLRVLESRTYRAVGGTREIDVDTRVIAATNVPLENLVAEKKLRSDLYYRLAVHHVDIPPLRQRPEDILPLAEHFLAQCRHVRRVKAQGFDQEARNQLQAYPYPGNARELRNIVERAAVMTDDAWIAPSHLQLQVPAVHAIDDRSARFEDNSEAARLLQALEQTRWNRRKAAELTGIPYSTLRYKLKVLGID